MGPQCEGKGAAAVKEPEDPPVQPGFGKEIHRELPTEPGRPGSLLGYQVENVRSFPVA